MERLEFLKSQPLTFADAAGFSRVRGSRIIQGTSFEKAAQDLVGWEVQRRAGLKISASESPLRVGTVVDMRLGFIRIPCRVTQALLPNPDEAQGRRAGFTYATLPGHPECGEESFLIEETGDGIRFTIEVRSIPGTWWVRLGGPLARLAQRLMLKRYLRMLDL